MSVVSVDCEVEAKSELVYKMADVSTVTSHRLLADRPVALPLDGTARSIAVLAVYTATGYRTNQLKTEEAFPNKCLLQSPACIVFMFWE